MVCYVKYVKNVLFAVLQRVMGKCQEIILNYYLEFCFSFHIFVAKYRQTPLYYIKVIVLLTSKRSRVLLLNSQSEVITLET